MTKKIYPVPGYVLVKPIAPEEKTVSGIILPKGNEDQQTGTVIFSAPPYKNDHGTMIESPVEADDQIIFKEWGKQKYNLDGQDYYLVKFDDIVAIIGE